MKRIGILVNREKDLDLKYTRILVEGIKRNKGEAVLPADISSELTLKPGCMDDNGVIENSDVVICLGGDGTFLKVARKAYKKDKPLLGINLGNLGFLTEVDKGDIESVVGHIVNGRFEVENRMMLDAVIIRDGKIITKDTALNDVVISRGALSRILHVKAYINNTLIDMFPGDGLIVSSPTGSTAYSLSAGGPIVEPDIDMIIVTPICPHILYSRSFITTGDRVVKAVIDESYCHEAMVTFDGQEGHEAKGGDIIEVRKSSSSVKIIRINKRDFFNVLRTKIYDRGEKLRRDEI